MRREGWGTMGKNGAKLPIVRHCRLDLTRSVRGDASHRQTAPISRMTLTVIHARERTTPQDREKDRLETMTDLSVESGAEAIEKIQWYALRWKIELFHKIVKSGCRAEESKLRTADRLENRRSALLWMQRFLQMVVAEGELTSGRSEPSTI
jgi:hypothetical protein